MLWLTIPLLVVALSVLVLWTILYILFCQNPEKKWRDKILLLMALAKRRTYQERHELSRLESERNQEQETIKDDAFSSFLNSIPVSQLEVFSGIGPVTVSKLENAGYSTLGSLQHARIAIHGLGDKRLADIYHAVHELTRQAMSRFESAACQQAQDMIPRIKELSSRYKQLEILGAARLKAAEGVIDTLKPSYVVAKKLNLISFWSKNWGDLLSPDVLNKSLPDLNAIINQAEGNAIAILKERRKQASAPQPPGKSPSVKKESQSSTKKAPDALHWDDHFANPPPLRQSSTNKAPGAFHAVVPVAPVVSVKESVEPDLPIPILPEESTKKSPRASKPAPLSVSLRTEPPPPTQPRSESQQPNCQVGKMEFSVQFAFVVARLDGTLSPSAKKLIHEYFQHQYAGESALCNRAKAFCTHLEKAPIRFENGISQFQQLFTAEERSRLFSLAGRILQTSDRESNKAVAFLQKMAWDLKTSFFLEKTPAKNPEPLTPVPQPLPPSQTPGATSKDDYLRILEIDPSLTISADLVRRQFNYFCGKYAPDKAASLGGEFVEMMEKRRQEVKMAATALLEELGEGLESPTFLQPKALRENRDLDEVFGV